MYRRRLTLVSLVVLSVGARPAMPLSPAASRPADDATLITRSLLSAGNTARLQRALEKGRSGQSLTLGVIGGSITEGAGASSPEKRYGNLVAAWCRREFPGSKIGFVNAGIGATGSSYGALRVRRDLLGHRPDLVIVEYGVNDVNTRACAETLEGLIRQVLLSPGQPEVILLFTMHNDGSNAQEWQARIGRHYGLPMISYRDALWPEIQAGHMKWEDVAADIVHPNDAGHASAARFITAFLGKVLRSLPPEGSALTDIEPVPSALISDLFAHVTLREADDLKPVFNQGWVHDLSRHAWTTDKPGSVMEFEVEGTAVLTMHRVTRGPMGRARVSVDGGAAIELEAWFSGTWGGYRDTTVIARGLPPGKHRVRVELLPTQNPQSTGKEFQLLGLGTTGPPS